MMYSSSAHTLEEDKSSCAEERNADHGHDPVNALPT